MVRSPCHPETNGAVATARISSNTVMVTPVGQGSTSVTVVGDGGIAVTIPISVSPSVGQVTASVLSFLFTQVGAANAQQFTRRTSELLGCVHIISRNQTLQLRPRRSRAIP